MEVQKAYRYFYKVGRRYLNAPEDVEDYVQTCLTLMLEAGEKAAMAVCAKAGFREFFAKAKGIGANNRKRYEFLAASQEEVDHMAHRTGLQQIMDEFIPANPNDALALKPYKVTLDGVPMFFDKYDLAEIAGVKPGSLKMKRWKKQPITLYRKETKFYPSLNSYARGERIRPARAKKEAQTVVLKWA